MKSKIRVMFSDRRRHSFLGANYNINEDNLHKTSRTKSLRTDPVFRFKELDTQNTQNSILEHEHERDQTKKSNLVDLDSFLSFIQQADNVNINKNKNEKYRFKNENKKIMKQNEISTKNSQTQNSDKNDKKDKNE